MRPVIVHDLPVEVVQLLSAIIWVMELTLSSPMCLAGISRTQTFSVAFMTYLCVSGLVA